MFVLTDSKPDALERLMRNLQIEKRELIYMLGEILRRNYDIYKEIVQGGGRSGFGGFSYRPNYNYLPYGSQYSQFKSLPSATGQDLLNPPIN